MKKLLSLLTATFFCSLATQAQISYGIKAGYSHSDMYAEFIGSQDVIPASHFHAGAVVDFTLSERLSLQPALLYSEKGGRYFANDFSAMVNPPRIIRDFDFHYLEMPINLLYKIPSGEGKFFMGGGGYLAYGLGGTMTLSREHTLNSSTKYKLKYYNRTNGLPSTMYISPFDAGLNATFGYEWIGLQLSASYSYGLSDVDPTFGGNDYRMKQRYLAISVGYLIQR